MLAICLAATAGFQGPGNKAAMTFSFLVLWRSACEKETDSCWLSYKQSTSVCVPTMYLRNSQLRILP